MQESEDVVALRWSRLSLQEEAYFGIGPQHSALEGFRSAARHAVRRSPLARRALLLWKNYVSGTALHMIGSKPG